MRLVALIIMIFMLLPASFRAVAQPGENPPFIHVTGEQPIPAETPGDRSALRLFIFVHDDILADLRTRPGDDPLLVHYLLGGPNPTPDGRVADIHASYLAWWVDEMAHILPGEKIKVTYVSAKPGLTDIRYDTRAVLGDWSTALRRHVRKYGLPWMRSYRNKFILLVPDIIEATTAGIAYPEGVEAVAALAGPWPVVAHEVGHLLGATHEEAETRFIGWWWCQTTMKGTAAGLIGGCYEYSTANRKRIQDYYHLGPMRPRAQGLVADQPVADEPVVD